MLNACFFFFPFVVILAITMDILGQAKACVRNFCPKVGRIIRMIPFHGIMAWKLVVTNIQYLMGSYEHVLFFPLF
jgi:hypothetical protein